MKLILGIVLAVLCSGVAGAAESVSISAARTDERGFAVYEIESPYQAGKTEVAVLAPEPLVAGRKYPVIYVLPVEAGRESRYGDGLAEVQKHDLHNLRQAIFVAPSFSHLPWYADHPTDLTLRQETYFLEVVLPFVEKTWPTLAEPEGRLLLGFSKSGWGAWSLLLRHPDLFGRAAAWDAPLAMDRLGQYGTTPIFGTQENFERYRLTDLLRESAHLLSDDGHGREPRLILTGYDGFRDHHTRTHALLDDLRIPHVYRDGPPRRHDWHSGWVPEAVDLLQSRDE